VTSQSRNRATWVLGHLGEGLVLALPEAALGPSPSGRSAPKGPSDAY